MPPRKRPAAADSAEKPRKRLRAAEDEEEGAEESEPEVDEEVDPDTLLPMKKKKAKGPSSMPVIRTRQIVSKPA